MFTIKVYNFISFQNSRIRILEVNCLIGDDTLLISAISYSNIITSAQTRVFELQIGENCFSVGRFLLK